MAKGRHRKSPEQIRRERHQLARELRLGTYERTPVGEAYRRESKALRTQQLRPKRPQPEAEALKFQADQITGGYIAYTYFPTSSSNPPDPRTAAAGYSADARVLKVAWGDGGTPYYYYEVTPYEWKRFREVVSPGRFINRYLNDHPYGPV